MKCIQKFISQKRKLLKPLSPFHISILEQTQRFSFPAKINALFVCTAQLNRDPVSRNRIFLFRIKERSHGPFPDSGRFVTRVPLRPFPLDLLRTGDTRNERNRNVIPVILATSVTMVLRCRRRNRIPPPWLMILRDGIASDNAARSSK